MVLLLIADVPAKPLGFVPTHREPAVTLLPREPRNAHRLVDPQRRGALDVAHENRDTMRGLEPGKDVDVIRRAADLEAGGTSLVDTGAKIAL